MSPDNRNATGGNGGESKNFKAGSLLVPMVQPTRDNSLRFDDRHAAFCAGLEQGRMERFETEVEEYARALLHHDADKMAGFARRLAAVKGPAWAAMIDWSGEADV